MCLFQIAICFASLAQCNGSLQLCNKPYNQVVFLGTHNAYNSAQDGFNLPNHNLNVANQLNDGVRCLLMDVYELEGELVVYHTFSFLGFQPFANYLNDIKTFLDDNPNEIITIIIECHTTAQLIENDIQQTGLTNYLYHHNSNLGWQSLQNMADNNQRLVIFSEEDNGTPEQTWYHYVWDYTVETHYSVNHPDDFNCDDNRGEVDNDLYLFNHFVTTPLGVGDSISAAIINDYDFLYNRIEECQSINNRIPNFVTVDFHELGNPIDVVNDLNGTLVSAPMVNNQNIKLYPNPASQNITIQANFSNTNNIQITNLLGQAITKKVNQISQSNNTIQINVSQLPNGIYFVTTDSMKAKFIKK